MTDFEARWRQRFERYGARARAEHEVSGWSPAGLRRRVGLLRELLDAGLLPGGARVLELGCGAGTHVRLLAARGHAVVGLDYSLPSLACAVAADPGRAGAYVAGDAHALPFRDGAFDGILCVGVLQALSRPEPALDEMARVLAPKGVLLVETLNPRNPLAAARRVRVALSRGELRLRYHDPALVEGALAAAGLTGLRRIGVLLPPRSLPALERPLAGSGLARALVATPLVKAITPSAFWIVGSRP